MEQISVEQDFNERLRILESRYTLLRERMLIINQNMINEYKKSGETLKDINQEVYTLKKDMAELKDVMNKILKELNLFAKKQDLKVVEKYINFWNPLNFVTENDVIKILDRRGENNSKTK